ncbi:hypothetical protein OsI_25833 [Oryza sativa Indica Group]|uniref:Uncharacterized protein n=1 Tax=Oryza sativa subsp. indica TaxID=39946 RepID=B8B5P6_ORYSI|nr:hypothetical protein OsI_25833 [Oryza sativa Indica Group]
MRPDARLDAAVFQLTPTRTRFDLVVIVNGRKEKIASGLLNPFLAHLKVAQDQIAKGGYSITLEPSSGVGAPWFTRGTVERFVRFVSTPEVLERVTTIESEILQLEDAISIQSNDNLGLRSVEDHGGKLTESNEGTRANHSPDADKAIVIYQPGSQPTPAVHDETTTHEENSKVQLLRVLETRKNVLRKEQAMAFARAVAAGFDIDNLGYLIAFAERFGASRLMRACSQFIELWKRKHETGQWIEVEPEAMSTRSEFPPFNPSGIVFVGDNMKQNTETMSVSNGEANGEDASKAEHKSGQQMGYQAAYPPWAMHPPPYHMQGMPYYPGPYYPPYPPVDDPRYHYSGRKSSRKHSSDSKESEVLDEGSDGSSSERGSSHGHKSHKKGKRSGKKKPSVVVIKNVNVTSKKHGSSESESQSSSEDGSQDSDDSHSKKRHGKHKSSGSKKKEGAKTNFDSGDDYNNKDESSYGQDADQGNWNAFQSFLMRAEEKTRSNDADMFSGEKAPPSRKKNNVNTADPILLAGGDSGDVYEQRGAGFDPVNGRSRAIRLQSNDELMMSGEGGRYMDGEIKEIEAGGGRYRRGTSEDFMLYGQERSMDRRSALDPLAEARYRNPNQVDKNGYVAADESFIIPLRSGSQDNVGPEYRAAIDIDVELPTNTKKTSDGKAGTQLFYEPDELMPERASENASFGYDPAMDYESNMMVRAVKVEDSNDEDVSHSNDGDVKKPEKEKIRSTKDGTDKRKKDAILRRLSAPKTPLNDAQKRAQNMRAYKADLQKLKKEQEEEQMKRLERLKLERQKRIAARSNGKSDPPKASREHANGLSKSVPSLTGLKKEKSGSTESFSERLKRLAEPKSIGGADHLSNPKSATTDHSRRRSMV